MKKVLVIANSDRHIKLCHIPYLKYFHENDYIVHVATDTLEPIEYCDQKINLGLKRNPYHIKNLKALKNTRRLIKKEKYDLIYCHTPIGGFLGRSGVIGLKKKPKVIYMAHGFHFYKKGPILNWLLIYPIEKFLSRYSNAVITMNEEDYTLAKRKFHCNIFRINGIGLNEKRLQIKNKNIKKQYNLKNKYIVTYIAEISKRKNQLGLLKALKKNPLDRDIIILLVGDSNIKNFEKIVQNYKNVKYIDYTDDVADYITISDLIISPSKQEGLPQNIVEALYFNKMVIATNIRGTKELINQENGILVNNLEEMIEKIKEIRHSEKKEIHNNIEKYKLEQVMKDFKEIIKITID